MVGRTIRETNVGHWQCIYVLEVPREVKIFERAPKQRIARTYSNSDRDETPRE